MFRMDSSFSESEHLARFYEYANRFSGSIKSGEFLDNLIVLLASSEEFSSMKLLRLLVNYYFPFGK